MNPLRSLPTRGQSIWLDYIDRHLLSSGALERLITVDGLRGVTSNPAIFEKAIFSGPRWQALADQGARTQRLLWASTGVKNPDYSDVRYIEDLIGPDTVNTVPPATLDAFRDHGRVRPSLEEDVEGAAVSLTELDALGISLDAVTDGLLDAGVALFVQSYDNLLARLTQSAINPNGD